MRYHQSDNDNGTFDFAIVDLNVYDLFGLKEATQANGEMKTDLHTVELDASKLASCNYCHLLRAGNFNGTRKLVLLK
ncbi:MAG TPA: hypothetical protein VI758_13225 [Bacteroidota bacterium]